jgi:hypothetical protein
VWVVRRGRLRVARRMGLCTPWWAGHRGIYRFVGGVVEFVGAGWCSFGRGLSKLGGWDDVSGAAWTSSDDDQYEFVMTTMT